jgi:hypothetical protein
MKFFFQTRMVTLDKGPKQRNMDIRFGLWNVRSLYYKAGSLMTVSRELSKYKFEFVGVQEVRWKGGGTDTRGRIHIFLWKSNENHELGTIFLCKRESYQQLSR